MNAVFLISLIALCVFMLYEYISLRRGGDEMAQKLGYGSDWRSVIK